MIEGPPHPPPIHPNRRASQAPEVLSRLLRKCLSSAPSTLGAESLEDDATIGRRLTGDPGGPLRDVVMRLDLLEGQPESGEGGVGDGQSLTGPKDDRRH